MAEVFVEYSEPVVTKGGRRFIARACGAEMDTSRWQGWIEFVPVDGGTALRSQRETTQPNRTDTAYWATGLTRIYLQGALERALNPRRTTPLVLPPTAVLNPFSFYRKGESLLRKQLSALSGWHLVNIIEAYGLSEQRAPDLDGTPEPVLVELIVSAVHKRTLAQT